VKAMVIGPPLFCIHIYIYVYKYFQECRVIKKQENNARNSNIHNLKKIVCKLEATDNNLSYQRMQQGR